MDALPERPDNVSTSTSGGEERVCEVCGPSGGILAAGFAGGAMGFVDSGGQGVLPAESFLTLFFGGMVMGLLISLVITRRTLTRVGHDALQPRAVFRFFGMSMVGLAVAWLTSACLSAIAILRFVSLPVAIVMTAGALTASAGFLYVAVTRAFRAAGVWASAQDEGISPHWSKSTSL